MLQTMNEASHASGQPSSRVLVLSTVAFTLMFAVWLMLGVLAVPIRKELGLTTIQFTWLAAIAVLSGSMLRLPFGIMTDRFGGRMVMSLLLLASAVPCFLVSLADSYVELMLCAFFFGFAGNSFSVGIAWNAAWFSQKRQGFALGTFGAGNVGASITKLIGPALIAALPGSALLGGALPGGWRLIPIIYSVLLVLMALSILYFAPVPERRPGAGRSLGSMLRPLREARVWRFGLYYVVVFGAYVAFSLWLPSYYQRVYGLSLASASLLTVLFIFPASLLRPLGGWLSDRYGARAVTYGVFVTMLISCLPLCLVNLRSGPPIALGAFFACVEVLGICMGIGKASVYKYIPGYFPDDVGSVGGLVGTLGALGGFVLPLAFGYLEVASGRPESCFWVMLVLVAWSFLWLHGVVTRLRRERAELQGIGDPVAG
jgi:MFS transporter, NNP family, nitrate/nitrite transporter